MKRIITIAAICAMSVVFARHGFHGGPAPHGPMHGPMHGPRMHMPPPPPRPHYHHHSSGAFWTGLGIGLAGSLVTPTPAPVVVAPPARIWIPPVYGERPIYRSGICVGSERYVITPGYWR